MSEEAKALQKAEKAMNYLVGQVLKTLRDEDKYADPLLVRFFLEEIVQSTFKKLEQITNSEPENTTSSPPVDTNGGGV